MLNSNIFYFFLDLLVPLPLQPLPSKLSGGFFRCLLGLGLKELVSFYVFMNLFLLYFKLIKGVFGLINFVQKFRDGRK